jgi:TonB family protein
MTSEKSLFEGALAKRENIFSRLRGGMATLLEPSTGEGAVPGDSPVHFDMVREDSVFSRLSDQLGFAFGELRRDPGGFVKVLVSPDVNNPDQIKTRQAAWALTVAVPVMVVGAFLFGIALYLFFVGRPIQADELAQNEIQIRELDLADMPEMPKQAERAGGGGGGGRKEPPPPSKGTPPAAALTPPILAPTTHNPPRPPALPVVPTIQAQPELFPKMPDPSKLGLPDGVEGPPSDGPGEGNGIGTGKGGGVGPGDGTGYGPGRGWNVGGGDPRVGGGDRDPNSKLAVSKAVIHNRPRPNYTEQARQNKTQGNVAVKVLLGAAGRVKSASVVRGLPDGLNEKAIEAVYQLSFTPARNAAGQPVDSWVTVTVSFTIR